MEVDYNLGLKFEILDPLINNIYVFEKLKLYNF